jgi:hypothetical protein
VPNRNYHPGAREVTVPWQERRHDFWRGQFSVAHVIIKMMRGTAEEVRWPSVPVVRPQSTDTSTTIHRMASSSALG